MSRGGGAGRGRRGGFGAPKTGVNSIEVPDSLIVSYEEMPLFPVFLPLFMSVDFHSIMK